jgi:peptidoglycan hydrolase CwlO-like protein
MEIIQVVELIIGSGGLLSIFYLIFKTGAIVERIKNNEKKQENFEILVNDRFNKVDERLNRIDERFNKLEQKIDEKFGKLETALNIISVQIGKLETRIEERTMKVIHISHEERELMNR